MHKETLLKALYIPVLLVFALNLRLTVPTNVLSTILSYGIIMLCGITIAVTTHRTIILGPSSLAKWPILHWTKTERMYGLYLFAIALLFSPVLLVANEDFILWLLILIVAAWLNARLCLLLPAAAVDKPIGFEKAWAISQKNLLLLLVSIYAPILALNILGFPILFLENADILMSLFIPLSTIVQAASLSVAYNIIINTEVN